MDLGDYEEGMDFETKIELYYKIQAELQNREAGRQRWINNLLLQFKDFII